MVGRVCLDCGISIDDRNFKAKRCIGCSTSRRRKRQCEKAKLRYKKNYVQKLRYCEYCSKEIEKGDISNRSYSLLKLCKECRSKSTWRDNIEVQVLKECLMCGKLMIIERKNKENWSGKPRNYCEECRPNHYKRRKFGYNPLMSVECNRCKREFPTRRIHKSIDGLGYCLKCKKRVERQERLKNSKLKQTFTEKMREAIKQEIYARTCMDCGRLIGIVNTRNARAFRCKECQDKFTKDRRHVYNVRQTGTVHIRNGTTIIRDKDGNPDWNKESEAIKIAKKYTFNPKVKLSKRQQEHLDEKTYYKGEEMDG